MKRRELTPTFPGRPPWIYIDDTWVCLAIHDAWVLSERRRHRLRRAAVHADRGLKSRTDFAAAQAHHRAFLRDARAWYRVMKIDPPVSLVGVEDAAANGPRKALPATTAETLTPLRQRVLEAVQAWPGAKARHLAAVAGLSVDTTRNVIDWLRQQGWIFSICERTPLWRGRYWPTNKGDSDMGDTKHGKHAAAVAHVKHGGMDALGQRWAVLRGEYAAAKASGNAAAAQKAADEIVDSIDHAMANSKELLSDVSGKK